MGLHIEIPPTRAPRTVGLEFRGDGWEYFKIWIINVLLLIISFGGYSAWAKVRTRQYFYSNMYLDGSNFNYIADPLTLFRGRVYAAIAVLVTIAALLLEPPFALVLIISVIFTAPTLLSRSRSFNQKMTYHRTVPFGFTATYIEGFMVIYVWPLLGIYSLGILAPWALLKRHQYRARHSHYGIKRFDFSGTYKEYAKFVLTMVGLALLIATPMVAVAYFFPELKTVAGILLAIAYIGLYAYYKAKLNTLFFTNLSINGNQFEASIRPLALGKVLLINVVLTLLTAGLYIPAAKVRMAKYAASCLLLHTVNDLDDFASAEDVNVYAFHEELSELFEFAF